MRTDGGYKDGVDGVEGDPDGDGVGLLSLLLRLLLPL